MISCPKERRSLVTCRCRSKTVSTAARATPNGIHRINSSTSLPSFALVLTSTLRQQAAQFYSPSRNVELERRVLGVEIVFIGIGDCARPGCHQFRCTEHALGTHRGGGCGPGMPCRWR